MKHLPIIIAALAIAIAGYFAITRGGLVAYGALVLFAVVLAKCLLAAGKWDLRLSIGALVVTIAALGASIALVYTTWESGEVIELRINTDTGIHSVRTWIMDDDGVPTVIYDLDPFVLEQMTRHPEVSVTRRGTVRGYRAQAVTLGQADADLVERISRLMDVKYRDETWATDVFYIMLGREAGREVAIIRLLDLG